MLAHRKNISIQTEKEIQVTLPQADGQRGTLSTVRQEARGRLPLSPLKN